MAGGREPPQWEAYPHHQFIHTVGALRCCDNGGCWKSRTLPLGDGADSDRPENLCVDVIGALPRCMDMISADDVISRIEMYLKETHFIICNHKTYGFLYYRNSLFIDFGAIFAIVPGKYLNPLYLNAI